MCKERRATVTKVDLRGKVPIQTVSLTLNRVQMVAALAVHSITIVSAALALAWWLGRVMVHQEFEKAIAEFHATARPAIVEVIDAKIVAHEKQVAESYAAAKTDVAERLARLEEHAQSTDARLERIEAKLDRLLER